MITKQCKECGQDFQPTHIHKKYCTKVCSKEARRKYVRNKVILHRLHKNQWTFLHNENTENEGDRIKLTQLKSPKIFDLLSDINKKHNIIGIQITEGRPDFIGVVVAESSSDEEE